MKMYKTGILILAGSLLMISCSSETKRDDHSDKSVFRYNEPAGVKTLDPAKVWAFEDFITTGHLFNGLVTLDENMELQPDLAKSWQVSEDGRVYTFNLRTNVSFHQSPLFTDSIRLMNAKDVVYSYLRIMDPEQSSPGKYVFQNIDRGSTSGYKGIVALNDSTVKIYLKESQPSFLYQLSLPYGSIVPHEVVEAYGNSFGEHPIGTGPFKMVKWKHGVKLVLTKNENYFERDANGVQLPYLDAVSVSFIGDKHSEFVQFKNGNFEMISGFNEDEKDELLESDGSLAQDLKDEFYLIKTPWLYTEYLGILVDPAMEVSSKSILNSKKVRQAVGYAIDREGFIKYLRNGVGIPATTGYVSKGMPGYDNFAIEGFYYDLNKAKKLLQESGYLDMENKPKVTLSATADYVAMCEYLQKTLGDLGLDVDVNIVESSYMNTSIAQFETNFYRKSWIADFPDAINYLQQFYSGNFYPEKGLNYTHFKNAEFDQLYEQALTEDNKVDRYQYYKEMQQIIHDEAPVIPIYYGETLRFYNKKVQGIKSNALNMLNLKEVKLDKQ